MRTTRSHTIRRLFCAVTITTLLAAASVASAQQDFGGPTDPDIDVQFFKPAPSPYGIFNLDASQTSSDLQVSGGLMLHYSKDPLVLVPAGSDEEIAIVENQVVAEALFALGLFDFLEIGVAFPIYLLNAATIDQQTIEGATLGDLRLRPKVTAISAEDNPVGLAFVLDLSLPTGDNEAFTSSGNVAARPGIVIDTKVDRLLLAANVGAKLQGTRGFGNLEVGSELTFGGGAQYEVVENRFLIAAEVVGSTSFDDFFKQEETPMEGLVGIKYRTNFGLNLETGLGRGIIAGYGAPEIRVFGGLRYAEYDPDWDGDGIPNTADECPRDPEDKDGFEDEDGCPDPDNDQDGVLDIDDECGDEKENKNGVDDGDGCPDFDPDADGDGIPDTTDKCVDEAEILNGVDDDDGCPDASPALAEVDPLRIAVLEPISFEGDKITDEQSFKVLIALANGLKNWKGIRKIEVIVIVPESEAALGQSRAESVIAALGAAGVDKKRLVPKHVVGEASKVTFKVTESPRWKRP